MLYFFKKCKKPLKKKKKQNKYRPTQYDYFAGWGQLSEHQADCVLLLSGNDAESVQK